MTTPTGDLLIDIVVSMGWVCNDSWLWDDDDDEQNEHEVNEDGDDAVEDNEDENDDYDDCDDRDDDRGRLHYSDDNDNDLIIIMIATQTTLMMLQMNHSSFHPNELSVACHLTVVWNWIRSGHPMFPVSHSFRRWHVRN